MTHLGPDSTGTMSIPNTTRLLALTLLTFGTGGVRGQGYLPNEAIGHMTPGPGLTARMVASEPLVRQPVAIEFDDRGRLWVIQYLQYPNPAGLQRVNVDRYSRTSYDRVPEPPPRGPKGGDRITILEDRDSDGKADHAKDFVSGLNLASGLAFGYGGVFVAQAPYLLFYPDRNRDDVPDGDPEVLLTGFGMEDAHSVVNSLTWGPDGWLYGLQGSTVTAKIRGIEFQQGVWRYHPRTRQFELFSEGGGNMWGLDFDRAGNLFACTNVGGSVSLHAVQGGYYWKSFGKHGPLHNPYTFGYFEHVPHEGVRGGHVSVGGLFYLADRFPEAYRGKFLAADLLDHSAHWHAIKPRGATFQAVYEGELLRANDTWFAPSDMTLGPDGSIYLADWHDKRTAHPDPDADWDRTNGRIIALDGPRPEPRSVSPNLASLSDEGLLKLLENPNTWYVRRARRLLIERNDSTLWLKLRKMAISGRSFPALEGLWILQATGGLDDATAEGLLSHADAEMRSWTIRLLGDKGQISSRLGDRLVELAKADPSVAVRAQLACSARRLPREVASAIVEAIALRDVDGADPYVPLLLWWAVERDALTAGDKGLEPYLKATAWQSSLIREAIGPRLIKRYAAERNERGDALIRRLITAAPSRVRPRLLLALDEALRGRKPGTTAPALVQDILTRAKANPDDVVLTRLAARLGDKEATARVASQALNAASPPDIRLALIDLLGELDDPSTRQTLLLLARSDSLEATSLAALRGLAAFEDSEITTSLLSAYAGKSASWRQAAREVLLGRVSSARVFLESVDAGKISAQDVPVDQVRRIALLHDEGLDRLARKLWGTIKAATPEEKLAEVRRLNNDLRASEGDAARGREIFTKQCATCHRLFGEGHAVGPDLTHANRSDRDFLLVSLVDPSSVVRKEYQAFLVALRDGRVLTGLIAEQTPESLTLIEANDQRTRVARDDIESVKEAATSLMPEGLYRQLNPDQLRDLFRFLQTQEPMEKDATR